MKIHESLFILWKSVTNIRTIYNLLNSKVLLIDNNDEVRGYFSNLINLETAIFIEEFDNFKVNIEPQFHDRMLTVRKLITPIRKRMNIQDLKDFRNSFIAHPWRDKDGNFANPDAGAFNVPRSLMELRIRIDLINTIYYLILREFGVENKEGIEHIKSFTTPPLPATNTAAINADHRKMRDEVEKIADELGLTIALRPIEYPE